jgi:hypothetical protein
MWEKSALQSSTKGAKAGLSPGDVVLEVNRIRVTSPEQFTKLWQESKAPTLLLISRNGRTLFLAANR